MKDTIYREDAIKALYKYSFVSKDVIEREINAIPSADIDLSEYSDKLWKNAYERGKADRKTEPTISKMEQVDEPTTEDCSTVEPQYEMGMGTLKCDNCSEYGSFKCTKCDGEMYFKRLEPKGEPQTESEGE